MASVSGILKVGEAQSAMRNIAARQRGPLYSYYGVIIALIAVGALAGFAIDKYVRTSNDGNGVLVGIVLGWVAYVMGAKKFAKSRFRRRLADRGISLELPLSMEVTADGLSYVVGDVRQFARWRAVTELFQSHGYWIFMVQASPWFAPKHFFTNLEDERSFVQNAMTLMNSDARDRSPDAIGFVSG